jgi:acylpyruvate hydrolase
MKTVLLQNSTEPIPVGKILCLGRNYPEHAKEMQASVPTTPVVFMKPSTAILSNNEPIAVPSISHNVHHEVELVVLIGKSGKSIPKSKAADYIAGYGIGLDMTLRDLQADAKKQGLPWTIAKGFDGSAPVSNFIPKDQIVDPHDLTICCRVNGTTRQQSSTRSMVFSIHHIIEYISSVFTLERGDLIFTGTPEGVGEVNKGDLIEAEIIGYTKITHPVV